jgi:DNA-binding MurR/RpiR family transcriptional regulator
VLITDAKGQSLARHAAVVIPVMCSQAGRIIIHGATLVCLEAIIMGIVAHDPSRTLSTLERLRELRSSIHK